MSKVQWRPQLNALTTPRSYKAQPVPKESLGYDEMAALIAAKNPLWSPDLVKSVLLAEREALKEQLVSGNQVSYENTCTWHLSISARLDSADAPLPPDAEINVQVYASKTFADEVGQAVQLERLPPAQKVPVIAGAEDTVLKLADVLNPQGLLRLIGTDLLFDPAKQGEGCVIAGTRSGSTAQSRFGPVSNTEALIMPDVPPQNDPWNNEYRVSITTRYTERGTLRTGTYSRLLRTPLTLSSFGHPNPPDVGILSGSAAAPCVTVTGGTLSADTMVRIEVIQDVQQVKLVFRLLDMQEGGAAGQEVAVTQNGEHILSGFAGSPLTSLKITVNNYDGLWELILADYGGRLVDVLKMRMGN